MQKIMFSDKFGLTQAVLEGRKTMTRRIIDAPSSATYMEPVLDLCGNIIKVYALDPDFRRIGVFYPKYRVGEVVAVAQSYKDAGYHPSYIIDEFHPNIENEAGWSNKMFVRADLMPNRIRFTGLRVERLQDISDEDCIREGIEEDSPYYWVPVNKSLPNWRKIEEGVSDMYPNDRDGKVYPHFWDSPRKAFAALIDKVSGRGTWGNSPWDFAYEFELVK